MISLIAGLPSPWSRVQADVGPLARPPIYAALEGVALGGISVVFEGASRHREPGRLHPSARSARAMASGVVKATENLLGVVAATGGSPSCISELRPGFFGMSTVDSFERNVGILFSLFVVVMPP